MKNFIFLVFVFFVLVSSAWVQAQTTMYCSDGSIIDNYDDPSKTYEVGGTSAKYFAINEDITEDAKTVGYFKAMNRYDIKNTCLRYYPSCCFTPIQITYHFYKDSIFYVGCSSDKNVFDRQIDEDEPFGGGIFFNTRGEGAPLNYGMEYQYANDVGWTEFATPLAKDNFGTLCSSQCSEFGYKISDAKMSGNRRYQCFCKHHKSKDTYSSTSPAPSTSATPAGSPSPGVSGSPSPSQETPTPTQEPPDIPGEWHKLKEDDWSNFSEEDEDDSQQDEEQTEDKINCAQYCENNGLKCVLTRTMPELVPSVITPKLYSFAQTKTDKKKNLRQVYGCDTKIRKSYLSTSDFYCYCATEEDYVEYDGDKFYGGGGVSDDNYGGGGSDDSFSDDFGDMAEGGAFGIEGISMDCSALKAGKNGLVGQYITASRLQEIIGPDYAIETCYNQ